MTPKKPSICAPQKVHMQKEVIQLPSFSDFAAAFLNPSLVSVLAEIGINILLPKLYTECYRIENISISRRKKNFINSAYTWARAIVRACRSACVSSSSSSSPSLLSIILSLPSPSNFLDRACLYKDKWNGKHEEKMGRNRYETLLWYKVAFNLHNRKSLINFLGPCSFFCRKETLAFLNIHYLWFEMYSNHILI